MTLGPQVGKFVVENLVGCLGPGASAPCDTVTVTGTVVTASPPVCGLSTTTLDFGAIPVGQIKDLTFQITNVGGGPLTETVGPSHCPEFAFLGGTSYGLAAGASATFTVRYIPSNPGHTTSCALVPAGANCPGMTFFGEALAP